jgi:hypothetical protein
MVAVGAGHHPVAFLLGIRSLPIANGGEAGSKIPSCSINQLTDSVTACSEL